MKLIFHATKIQAELKFIRVEKFMIKSRMQNNICIIQRFASRRRAWTRSGHMKICGCLDSFFEMRNEIIVFMNIFKCQIMTASLEEEEEGGGGGGGVVF